MGLGNSTARLPPGLSRRRPLFRHISTLFRPSITTKPARTIPWATNPQRVAGIVVIEKLLRTPFQRRRTDSTLYTYERTVGVNQAAARNTFSHPPFVVCCLLFVLERHSLLRKHSTTTTTTTAFTTIPIAHQDVEIPRITATVSGLIHQNGSSRHRQLSNVYAFHLYLCLFPSLYTPPGPSCHRAVETELAATALANQPYINARCELLQFSRRTILLRDASTGRFLTRPGCDSQPGSGDISCMRSRIAAGLRLIILQDLSRHKSHPSPRAAAGFPSPPRIHLPTLVLFHTLHSQCPSTTPVEVQRLHRLL